jgi:hypothetical protein
MASRSLTVLRTRSMALCALPAFVQPQAAPPAPAARQEHCLAEPEIGRRFRSDPAHLLADGDQARDGSDRHRRGHGAQGRCHRVT